MFTCNGDRLVPFRVWSHEQHFVSRRLLPGRAVRPEQVHFRRAPVLVRQRGERCRLSSFILLLERHRLRDGKLLVQATDDALFCVVYVPVYRGVVRDEKCSSSSLLFSRRDPGRRSSDDTPGGKSGRRHVIYAAFHRSNSPFSFLSLFLSPRHEENNNRPPKASPRKPRALFFVCVSTREEVEEKSPQNVTHVSSLRHHHHHHLHHHQSSSTEDESRQTLY